MVYHTMMAVVLLAAMLLRFIVRTILTILSAVLLWAMRRHELRSVRKRARK